MLKDAIDQVKDRILVSAVVSQKVKLKRCGNRFSGLCPFHDEKTPSFSVNDKGKFFHCFGCGKTGDVIDFISATENLTFMEALEKLAIVAGVEIKEIKKEPKSSLEVKSFLNDISLWFEQNLHSPLGKNAKKYIENRATKEVISAFKIGYCSSSISSFLSQKNIPKSVAQESGIVDQNGRCYFVNRLVFPIHNKKGDVIGFGSRTLESGVTPKYINSAETDLFKKSEILYGINIASKFCTESLIVVEGYMDVLSLFRHGYKNSVGVLGTSITALHIEKCLGLSKQLIFCFDGDTAGIGAAKKVIKLILENFLEKTDVKTKFVFLPDGFDPDDLLKENPNAFEVLLNKAKLLSEAIFFLSTLKKMFTTPEDFLELERILYSYVAQINNVSAKNHFNDFFKKQIFQLKRYKKFNDLSLYSKLLLASGKTEKSEVLLNIVLEFPQILQNATVEDFFSMISFSQKDSAVIQQGIIDFLNSRKDENCILKENLMQFFSTKNNLKTALENFIAKRYSFRIKDYDQAKILWDKVIKEIEYENLQKEYQNLLSSSKLDEKTMQKAQNILQQIQKYHI